jgi:transposase
LQSVPGVGPVTAATVIAALDTPTRFASAGHVAAYLGLVPREWSSGDRQQRGGITKTGNRRARAMLGRAAWGVWRDRHPAPVPLRQWAERLAARRGKRVEDERPERTRTVLTPGGRFTEGTINHRMRDHRHLQPPRWAGPAPLPLAQGV